MALPVFEYLRNKKRAAAITIETTNAIVLGLLKISAPIRYLSKEKGKIIVLGSAVKNI